MTEGKPQDVAALWQEFLDNVARLVTNPKKTGVKPSQLPEKRPPWPTR